MECKYEDKGGELTEQLFNSLAKQQDVDVLTTSITSFLGLKGAFDYQTNTVVLDVTQDNHSGIVDTFGHEIAHGQGIKNETSADLIGKTVDWAFDSGIKHNQSTINKYKNQLGDGKDENTQAQNQDILKKDNQTFIDNVVDHPDEIDDKTSYKQSIANSLFCWNKECTEKFNKLDKAQEEAYRKGQNQAISKFVEDIKNIPNVPKEVYEAVKNDPKGTAIAILKGLSEIPGDILDTTKIITKVNAVGDTPAEFEKLGNAEMAAILNGLSAAVSAGTITIVKKGATITVGAVKNIKLKADFDPNLKVQTNGLSTKTPLKIVELKSGSKGNWNRIANNPEPNTIYKFENGYNYKTDANGRVSSVQADLQLGKNDRNTYQQKVSGRDDRASRDHGGHLIASMFKGPGEGINIVPMDKAFNGSGGKWYQLETDWKKALESNQSVNVSIRPVYSGTSKQPDSFIVIQKIGSAKAIQVTLKNTASGK